MEGADLPAALEEVSPRRFAANGCVAVLKPLAVNLFIHGARRTLPPIGNDLGIEIIPSKWVSTSPLENWVQSFVLTLASAVEVRYAWACQRAEFASLNLIDDPTGLRAIGVGFAKALPGLYWFNYFGRECVESLTAPRGDLPSGVRVWPHPPGLVVKLAEKPSEWRTPTYAASRSEVIRQLGPGYFFNRVFPDRPTSPIPFQP